MLRRKPPPGRWWLSVQANINRGQMADSSGAGGRTCACAGPERRDPRPDLEAAGTSAQLPLELRFQLDRLEADPFVDGDHGSVDFGIAGMDRGSLRVSALQL